MVNITTSILYEENIELLGDKYKFLKDVELSSSAFRDWHYTNTHHLGYKSIKALKIIFIGQTGYGKSSLINKLIKKDIFETSDYESCTKTLQSADFFLHHKMKHENLAYHLSFVDLPGIGENDKSDKQYLQWYQNYIEEAAVILYLFRADKRDHTQDEFFFNHVFNKSKSKQLICVISQADKIEPLNRGVELSNDQKKNLLKKEGEINNKPFLRFDKINAIHVSSHLGINIKKLEKKVLKKLKGIV